MINIASLVLSYYEQDDSRFGDNIDVITVVYNLLKRVKKVGTTLNSSAIVAAKEMRSDGMAG